MEVVIGNMGEHIMKWTKVKRIEFETDESTIFYESDAGHRIESRKRAIPHANRGGSWMHTSYFLILPDGTEKEYHRLQDAKEAAEEVTT